MTIRNMIVMFMAIVLVIIAPVSAALTMHTSGINAKDITGKLNDGTAMVFGIPIMNKEDAKLMMKDRNLVMDLNVETPKGTKIITIANSGVKISKNQAKTVKTVRLISDEVPPLTGPKTFPDGGDATEYILSGKRWNTEHPQLKHVLVNNSVLTSTGLNANDIRDVILMVTNDWEHLSNQNLFSDTDTVTISTTIYVDRFDKNNAIGFQYKPTSSCIAWARTYYKSTLVDGYKSIVESDITYNTRYGWRIPVSPIVGVHLQTITMHEMGHTLGLNDLYNSGNKDQIMYGYYSKVKIQFGNGDANGIWTMYH